jgi:hypothetical protein
LSPAIAGIYRRLPQGRAQVYRILTFSYSLPRFSSDDLFYPLMTETAQRKRGGRAYHSILEPHFDFIRQQRQRRKSWQEIADLLFTEKGIHVTLYAPYQFYRRRLKRPTHWENAAADFQSGLQSAATQASQSRSAPLLPKGGFKRPDLSKLNMEEFS